MFFDESVINPLMPKQRSKKDHAAKAKEKNTTAKNKVKIKVEKKEVNMLFIFIYIIFPYIIIFRKINYKSRFFLILFLGSGSEASTYGN